MRPLCLAVSHGVAMSAVAVVSAVAVCHPDPEPPRVATITVEACVPVVEYGDRKLGDLSLEWVRMHVRRVLERNPGVVVTGELTQKAHVRWYGGTDFVLLDVVPVLETGVWFVKGEEECESFQPGKTAQIFATDRCCDVLPPGNVPCLLDVGQAAPVAEALRRIVENRSLD